MINLCCFGSTVDDLIKIMNMIDQMNLNHKVGWVIIDPKNASDEMM